MMHWIQWKAFSYRRQFRIHWFDMFKSCNSILSIKSTSDFNTKYRKQELIMGLKHKLLDVEWLSFAIEYAPHPHESINCFARDDFNHYIDIRRNGPPIEMFEVCKWATVVAYSIDLKFQNLFVEHGLHSCLCLFV